jgi:acetolactate synthase-1/2/3 large subunit
MAEEKKEEKMILETLKPGAEIGEVEAAPEAIGMWLLQDVNIHTMTAEMLKAEGVEYMFHLISGYTAQGMLEMAKQGIKGIHVRHESTATFAAEGWARLAGRPGVAVIGPGTGVTNSTSGVVQGMSAASPCVIIVYTDLMATDNLVIGQGISRAYKLYDGITKYTARVGNPTVLPFEFKRAFRSCMTPPTGPVCLEFPFEFSMDQYRHGPRMQYMLGYNPLTWSGRSEIPKRAADPQVLEKAMEWFFEAERPAIVAGDCLVLDDAIPELKEFVELTGIPTHTRRTARGAISEYDPLNCYGRARGRVLRRSDRTMVIGLRIQYLENFGLPPFWSDRAMHIQVQTCPEYTCTGMATQFELIGNIKTVLRQMIDWVKAAGIKKPPEKWDSWRQEVAGMKEHYEKLTMERTKAMEGKTPLHPDLAGKLMSEFLHEELDDEVYSIIDGFTAASYFTDWQKVKFAPSVLDASDTIGFGHSPGHALAFGLLNNRDRPIIAIMGDGAIGANGMDIETCARWNIPCVFVHENNNCVATGMQYIFTPAMMPTGIWERDSTATLPNIRYDQMFKEFGCHTELVERDVEVKPALKRAFDFVKRESKPAFVEMFIDADVLQEIWTTGLMIMCVGNLPWDELSEKTKEILDQVWERTPPLWMGMANPNWAEELGKYRAEKAKK